MEYVVAELALLNKVEQARPLQIYYLAFMTKNSRTLVISSAARNLSQTGGK